MKFNILRNKKEKTFVSEFIDAKLRETLTGKGEEVDYTNADVIFSDKSKDIKDKEVVEYRFENSAIKLFSFKETWKVVKKAIRGKKQKQKTALNLTKTKEVELTLLRIAKGEEGEFSLPKTISMKSFIPLLKLYAFRGKKAFEKEYEEVKDKYSLTEEEAGKIAETVSDCLSTRSNNVLEALRHVDYIYMEEMGYLLPNISDNIISNIMNISLSLIWYPYSKPEKLKEKQERILEQLNNMVATIRNSLFSKNAWNMYSNNEGKGLYSLFVVDNTLDDDEVVIPRPLKSDKEYPNIGDTLVVTRHPVTTLMFRMKVRNYSTDGSIRLNASVMLSLYGDADGDALVVTWEKWSKDLEFSSKETLKEFNKIAGIKIEQDDYKNSFKKEDFLKEKDDNKDKLLSSSLEQALAKLQTKKVTGEFGALERDYAQNLIINGYDITVEDLYTLSRISQIPVQCKNILEKLKDGLSEEQKETFKLIFEGKDRYGAISLLSKFLSLSREDAGKLYNDIYEIKEITIQNNSQKEQDNNEALKELANFF